MTDASEAIHILHVDADPELADRTATSLEREDGRFVVETARDADEALDRLEGARVDCVVSGYEMPGRNGIEFLEAVRGSHPDLPFILFTGQGSEAVASDAISAGVTDYLRRDSGADRYAALATRIRNAVERATAQTERKRHLDAIETAREGISILDADRTFVYVNQAYADLYGYDPEDLLGEDWEILYRDEDIDTIRGEVLPTVEAEGYWHGETIGVRADGSTFHEDHVLSLTDAGEIVCTVRDVTERVERVRELDETSARLEALFENSPDMINLHDAEGTIRDVNRRFCEVFGATEEELIGRQVWEVDDRIDPEELRETLAGTAVGERFKRETEYRLDDGETLPVEVHVVRLDIEGDDRFLVVSRDITERKNYERQLRAERQFVQSIFDALPDPLYAFDTEGYPIRWNDRFEEITGYDAAALSDVHVTDFVLAEEAGTIETNFRTILEERRPVTVDATIETKGGDRIPFELAGGPLEDADGNLRGITGMGRDITERKRHERRLRALNETSQRLMTVETREGVAELGVSAARDVLGLDANAIHFYEESAAGLVPVAQTEEGNELVGDPITLPVEDSIAGRAYDSGETLALADVREAPDVHDSDTSVRSELYFPLGEHGTLIAASEVSGAFDQEDRVLGEILAGSIATALDQVANAERLRARERELTRQNERLEEFASVVSHDLRTPLSVVEGRLKLAKEECDSEHLDSMSAAVDRMGRIIEDVLWLSREGRDIGSVEPVDLGDAIGGAWTIVADDATRASLDRAEGLSAVTIRADVDRLRQLLENLFRNAIEHGGDEVTVTVGTIPEDGGFYVADDGPGIPESEREDVFTAGYSTSEDGTGFGLNIVKQIADAHGWGVEVVESDGGGARFEFTGIDTEP